MYYVVQEGLKEEIKCNRSREAVAKWEELVKAEPTKKAGVFRLGDDTMLHWHFGDCLTSPRT